MYIKSISIHADRFPTREVYPFNIPVFQFASQLQVSAPVTIFVGQNGSGKSALMDAVARRCRMLPWGGSKIHKSHDNPLETQLADHISLGFEVRHPYGFHFRAEAFFNFAASLDDMMLDDPVRKRYFGGKSLNMMSHGESFLSFFKSYSFGLEGLYLVDEPEAALSPRNQVEFVRTILEGVRSGKRQYMVATHSPVILACPGACLLSFDGPVIQPTVFRKTRHYTFYKAFLDAPESFFLPGKRGEDDSPISGPSRGQAQTPDASGSLLEHEVQDHDIRQC
jgi:predicted ATPase